MSLGKKPERDQSRPVICRGRARTGTEASLEGVRSCKGWGGLDKEDGRKVVAETDPEEGQGWGECL
jgi:hypothetical protein